MRKVVLTLLSLAVSVAPCVAQHLALSNTSSAVSNNLISVSETNGTDEPTWLEVTVDIPGSLGVDLLDRLNVLSDAKWLRLSGQLNDADWSILYQCTQLQGLDLSRTSFTNIPNRGSFYFPDLSSITLPEGVITIGNDAFNGTKLTEVAIPSSVEVIGARCFFSTPLTVVAFPKESNLKTIGSHAFASTKLLSVEIPGKCETINNNAFDTSAVTSVIFPESLTYIGHAAFNKTSLQEIVLPVNLSYCEDWAFAQCPNLISVTLCQNPDAVNGNAFIYSYAVSKVVSPSMLPPTARFSNISNIDLVVPDAALGTYKLDSYWYQAKSISGGAQVGKIYVTAGSGITLNDSRRIDGKPNMYINAGGKLTVSGTSPQAFAEVRMANNGANYGQINCSAPVTADAMFTNWYTNQNTWQFISPSHDVDMQNIYCDDASASFVVRYYDGATRATNGNGGWQNVEEPVLKAGHGYIMQANRTSWMHLPATTADMSGAFRNTDFTIDLDENPSENAANAGWNFVGNPYPCWFDTRWLDFTAPITVWQSNTYRAYSLVDDRVVLAPMQPFFVQKPEGVDQITFVKEGRQFDSTPRAISEAAAPVMKASANRTVCDLTLTGAGADDATRVVLNSAATLGYDYGMDAAKFMSPDSSVPQLWSLDSDGERMAINERPLADGTAPISVSVPGAGDYTLRLSCPDSRVDIRDLKTGDSGKEIKFTASQAGVVEDRFIVDFRNILAGAVEAVATDLAEVEVSSVEAGVLSVKAPRAIDVTVITVDGRVVCSAFGSDLRISLPAGIYVVKADGAAVKQVVK